MNDEFVTKASVGLKQEKYACVWHFNGDGTVNRIDRVRLDKDAKGGYSVVASVQKNPNYDKHTSETIVK
jgi:hypothetical protein